MSAIPILLYHSVDDDCAPAYRRWMVTPERFLEQMGHLAEHGYHAETVSSLVDRLQSNTPLEPRTIVITFDDGLRDFATGAMPVLARFGFPATLYLVTGCVGSTSKWLAPLGESQRRMLEWSELQELASRGIEIGAHTVSHPQLDILPTAAAYDEVRASRQTIELALDRMVYSFAYPHGYASAATREMVRRAGFRSACGVRHAMSSTDENRFKLSRIVMTDEVDAEELEHLLADGTLTVAPDPDSLAIYGWRMLRRLERAVRPAS